MAYRLAHDARRGAGVRRPPAHPRAAAGQGLVTGRARRPLLPQPVHLEPHRDRSPPGGARPARPHRPRARHHARPARRVGRGRRRRHPSRARPLRARPHHLAALPRAGDARRDGGQDAAAAGAAARAAARAPRPRVVHRALRHDPAGPRRAGTDGPPRRGGRVLDDGAARADRARGHRRDPGDLRPGRRARRLRLLQQRRARPRRPGRRGAAPPDHSRIRSAHQRRSCSG